MRCRSLNGLCGDLNGHLHGLGKAVSHVHVNRLNCVDVNPGDHLQEGRGIGEVKAGGRAGEEGVVDLPPTADKFLPRKARSYQVEQQSHFRATYVAIVKYDAGWLDPQGSLSTPLTNTFGSTILHHIELLLRVLL